MNIRQQYDQTILPTYAPPPPVFVRGIGSQLWDEAGRDYIDFGGGIAVLSLGHCPPQLSEALAQQAARLMHLSNLHVNAEAVRLAQLLIDNTFAARVYICNSGTEANEAALKLARRYGVSANPDKYRILSFDGGFHGRGGMAMAVSAQEKVREGFGPLMPGCCFAPFNDLAAASAQMDARVCAIIVEPVQGEKGVIPATTEFLKGLRALANQHSALLIFDEIQSGAGRCGTLYSYMQHDVLPDLLTTAKGLGGGFPVAAMLAGDSVASVLGIGTHGTTYGGNALAARAAYVVLETLLSDGFLVGVQARGEQFAEKLQQLNKTYNCFSEIRQCGLLIGCDMAAGWQAKELAQAALAEGLVVITAGVNTLRLAPALNIPSDNTDEGFIRLQRTLAALATAQKERKKL